jgi:hypothetical protein
MPKVCLALIVLAGCTKPHGFERACRALKRGMAHDDAAAHMARVGAKLGGVNETDVWWRRWLITYEACEVDFDRRGRLATVNYCQSRLWDARPPVGCSSYW